MIASKNHLRVRISSIATPLLVTLIVSGCSERADDVAGLPSPEPARISVEGFGRLGAVLQPPSPPALPRPELPTELPLSSWSDSDVDALLSFKQFRP
jgi:hypothetical protein